MKQPDYRPYTQYIDRLLKVADAHAPGARAELEQTLEIAWALAFTLKRREQPPADLFKQTQNHLRQTITLLERLEKYADWRGGLVRILSRGSRYRRSGNNPRVI